MTARKILVLSFYFEPDLSAGSFRTTALVNALLDQDPDVLVDVLTTMPNRYGTFTSAAPAEEVRARVRIRRVALPAHKSGIRDQSRAFIHFFQKARRLVVGEHYSLVYATSSRLLTASLGAILARRIRAPLYLDIRDIFVDTMADVLPRKLAPLITPFLALLERWTINSATHVNLVSRGFANYFGKRYARQSFSYFSNGIDEVFLASTPADTVSERSDRVRVVYAGNIGEGQGLDIILPRVATRLSDRVEFTVIGDGGRRAHLEQELAAARVQNVTLLPPMPRRALIDEYHRADVLFLHLNDYDAFRKVLPSKIFEYAALGKPVWAGLAGYSAEFVSDEVRNAAVFKPCDVDAAVMSFTRLDLRGTPRPEFIAKFRRSSIMQLMATDLLRVARGVSAPIPTRGT